MPHTFYFPDWIERVLRLSAGASLLFAFFLLNAINIPFPFIGPMRVPFVFMAVFYWSIFRPTLMPLWLSFLMGIFLDLIGGTPLGLNAFAFVITQTFIYSQRRLMMSQPFIVVWLGFALVYLVILFLQLFIVELVYRQSFDISEFWVLIGFGIVAFPFVYIVLHAVHKLLPPPGSSAR